ncbi:MAG: hypothetical protein RLN70_10830, partial [Rhodospirillaceae bacterium]
MSDFKSYLPNIEKHHGLEDSPLSEVLFEIVGMGNSVKVSAIDPITNTEVSIVGSIHSSPYTLKMNALRKLDSVVRKKQSR